MITVVREQSQVAQVRRSVGALAGQLGAAEAKLGQIAIVVTELATNLLKHGGGGEVLAGRFSDAEGNGLEVLALDRGSGMENVERCMEDGYSTAGSLGQGLGAVSRLSDRLRIWSRPGQGTAAAARFLLNASPGPHLQCGTAVAPYPGEIACGDAWAVVDSHAGPTLLLADGSGHGIEAQRAAETAVRLFRQHGEDPIEDLLLRLHRGLMSTRGAAVAIARINAATSAVQYGGIGNISGSLLSGGKLTHMVSHNGTAGHVAPRIRQFVYPFTGTPMVILHSDGLTARWDLASYPGLPAQHPALLAGVLLRDFRRGRDDASVVAARPVR